MKKVAAGILLAMMMGGSSGGLASTAFARSCPGDCNDDGSITIDELTTAVGIALGQNEGGECVAVDLDADGRVEIHELVLAVGQAQDGCDYPYDRLLRLNQIQVLGSHNSYHIEPRPALLAAIADILPDLAASWEYTHPPLDEQFDSEGIRQVELDVFADPEGGLYANRAGLLVIGEDTASGIPELDLPGFKVLHVQDLDFESSCWTLIDCLEMIRSWSDAHPRHAPIMVLVEAKDDELPDVSLGFVTPIPIGSAEFDALDDEIRSVFPPGRIITPDEVRGKRETLEEAIRLDGWPTLAQARGRVLFALDNEGDKREAYIAGHPSLAGRVMFTSSLPADSEAGFVKLNDPIADFDLIRDLVAEGFIVRTRADADTKEARKDDATRRDAALSSGAQFVSTDYPEPNPDFGTGYHVTIPGGAPARCNPLNAPADCTALDIENPDHLGAN